MGGEKPGFQGGSVALRGSPPRGRGKEFSFVGFQPHTGITPAWAGKRQPSFWLCAGRWDHPRVGGEKRPSSQGRRALRGSPPRGRGKVHAPLARGLGLGITPAWAGKRTEILGLTGTAKDHPRVGGEKGTNVKYAATHQGSPPRGRGKEFSKDIAVYNLWITPAWAGKRLKRSHRSGIFISGPIPFHSVLHRPAGSGGSRAGRDGAPAGQPQNAGPA